MKLADTRAWLYETLRAAVSLLLISSFSISFAQAQPETREAKFARAANALKEAHELAKQNNAQASAAAIPRLQAAEAIFTELGDKERLLPTVMTLGILQLRLGQKEPGVASLSRALSLAAELDRPEPHIRILAGLGEYFFNGGRTGTDNKERARGYLEQAAAVIERTEPKPDPLSYDAYELLGKIWMSLYNPRNANRAFLSAYRLRRDKPPAESIPAIIKYAAWQIDMGYPRYGVAPLEDARRKAIAAKIPELEALATWAIGDLMADKFRDLPNAKRYLERADELLKMQPNEALTAKMLVSWGKYYYASFDLVRSAEYFEKAVNLQTREKPAGLEGELMLHFGILNFTVGSYEQAIRILEKAAELNGAEGRKLREMESLRYLARSQNALGKIDEARRSMARASSARGDTAHGWESAESVAILIDNSDFLIDSFRMNPGKDPMSDVRLDRAKKYLEIAYPTAKRERMKEYHSISARRLGLVYSLLGNQAKALEMLNDALLGARSAVLPVQEAHALTALMDLSVAVRNIGAATFYGKSAVNVYQQLRKRIADLSTEERVRYLSTIEGTYRRLASLLIQQGRIAEAEQVLTMLKEEELIEYVRRDDAVSKSLLENLALTDDEKAAMQRYDSIATQITALGREFEELDKERRSVDVGAFPKQARYDELQQKLADATATFEKFLESLKLKFGERDTRVADVDSSLQSTLRDMNARRTAVVSTIVGEDELNLIVTTSQTQRAHTVKKSAVEINELVVRFRQALTSPTYDPRPAGQHLYDILVKPIEGDLAGIKADTIVWSLDGTLRYIPPSALFDKQKGYLAERFSNVLINLTSRDKITSERKSGEQLSILGVGVSKAVDGFSPLAAVPDELDCVVDDKAAGPLSKDPQCSKGVLTGRKLIDERFTLPSFEGELGRYPIVHVASHFKLTPGDEKNSFLLLGGGAVRQFTVERLKRQSLNAELLVLSACNTATPGGAKANGLEIEGFHSVAQKRGAKAVMASLWPVADPSTKDLMVEFYKLYGTDGRSKADALRLSQVKMLRGKSSASDTGRRRSDPISLDDGGVELPRYTSDPNAPFAHPFYWSPFVLIGNWR